MAGLLPVLPGLGLSLSIALSAFLIVAIHQSFDPLIISLFLGLFVSNIFPNKDIYAPGIEKVLQYTLPLGIGLFGAGLIFKEDLMYLWPMIILILLIFFLLTFYIARILGLDRELSFLLAVGLSVCGASAIAIISGVTGAKKENTGAALISVITVGLGGMVLYILLSNGMVLSPREMAFMSGATLPNLSLVKIASVAAGAEAVPFALNLKLARVGTIGFFALWVLFFGKGEMRGEKPFRFPWFMVLFFVLGAAVNLFELGPVRRYVSGMSNFLLSVSLAAVGLSVEFESLSERGLKPVFAVLFAWFTGALIAYALISSF
jgi:uncharacterized integral membrane protein (TIGR00698 family)